MRTWYQLMVDAIDLFGDAMNDERWAEISTISITALINYLKT